MRVCVPVMHVLMRMISVNIYELIIVYALRTYIVVNSPVNEGRESCVNEQKNFSDFSCPKPALGTL